MKVLEKAKAFGQGFLARAALAEQLKDEDPAKSLLAWMGTAVDNFLSDSGGPQNAADGWDVFLGWIKKHREQHAFDPTQPAEQVLQRIASHAERSQNDRSHSVTDLRVVEPWIDEFFAYEEVP